MTPKDNQRFRDLLGDGSNFGVNKSFTIQERKGYKIACLDEIILQNTWITIETIKSNYNIFPSHAYSSYLASH